MSRENVEFARRWWAGCNEQGLPPLELCDEQIEIRNPDEFPVVGPYLGHEGVRQWASDVFEVIDDPRTDVEAVVETGDGETFVWVLKTTGRWKHTQLTGAGFDWAAIMTVRRGKVIRAQGYLKKEKALEAAGLRE